ncbi:MAG: kinase [Flavobacteriaceae bacterium]|nr:kinase [Flavobacteriaceae bacterium]
MEHVHKVDDIDHPAVREVLRYLDIHKGIEIHHDGDLPARTGLGSSSSFTVGLLNSLYALLGRMPSKAKLAEEAIYIEQQMCKENVGCQDQSLAAYGGFNFIEFGGSEHLQVNKVIIPSERKIRFQDHLMLFFTGFSRTASVIAEHQIKNIPNKKPELKRMHEMAVQGLELLKGDRLDEFGTLLDESWQIKRQLSDKVSTPRIDEIYDAAKSAGATGGKLLGAGGGGFVLLFVPPQDQEKVKEKLEGLLLVPFSFENLGSQIIFYQPNGEFLNA